MESIALLKWIIWKKRWFFHSLTLCGLLSVALNQHQAITNITKHSIQQRIFRRKIRK
jgi:hypothetical protein